MNPKTWQGQEAEEIERELGIDESGVIPLTRRRLEEPSIDKPPMYAPSRAFGVWPPIRGPQNTYLRAVTVIDDRTIIATQSPDRHPCAAVATTSHGANRWYYWILDPHKFGEDG